MSEVLLQFYVLVFLIVCIILRRSILFGFLFLGKDLIGLAQTGSGKTGAFALPILQAFLESPHPFFACALSPTRFDI
jgi:hypothetical protein